MYTSRTFHSTQTSDEHTSASAAVPTHFNLSDHSIKDTYSSQASTNIHIQIYIQLLEPLFSLYQVLTLKKTSSASWNIGQ